MIPMTKPVIFGRNEKVNSDSLSLHVSIYERFPSFSELTMMIYEQCCLNLLLMTSCMHCLRTKQTIDIHSLNESSLSFKTFNKGRDSKCLPMTSQMEI